MKNENIFSTRDLCLATTLSTLKYEVTNIDYQIEKEHERPIGYFGFEKTDALMETVRLYKHGEILVEPQRFLSIMRGLKAEVTNEYKGPRSKFSGPTI